MRYRMMADAAELLSAGLATLINKPFEGGAAWAVSLGSGLNFEKHPLGVLGHGYCM